MYTGEASHEERYRWGMARAAERVKESARHRATLARANRYRVALPSQTETMLQQFVYPAAVAALWVGIAVWYMH